MAKAKKDTTEIVIETVSYKIEGVAPILFRSAALVDPLNPWTVKMKKIHGKRNKTNADYLEIRYLEFMGSLYLNEEGRLIVPGLNLEAMLFDAAKQHKLMKRFQTSIFCEDALLGYDGPLTAEELWEDGGFKDIQCVVIKGVKIIRCRPRFFPWSLDVVVGFYTDQLDREQIDTAMRVAGRLVGLGDYIPRHGRFIVAEAATIVKEKSQAA